MDMHQEDRCNSLKNEDNLDYDNSGNSSDWQFSNPPRSLVSGNPSVTVNQGNQMGSTPCSSISMDDPFSTGLWNLSTKSTNLNLCKNNLPESGNAINENPRLNVDSLSIGGALLQPGSGNLHPSLSHFPSDSTFIERAARFSCFIGSNVGGMMNPFSATQSQSPYSNASIDDSEAQIQKNEINMTEAVMDASLSTDRGSKNGSLMKEQKENKDNLHGVDVSSNESSQLNFTCAHQEYPTNLSTAAGNSSPKGLGAMKRRRPNEDMAFDRPRVSSQTSGEMEEDNVEFGQKDEQNSATVATVNPRGKQVKDNTESSKEDFIHIRARRGQATNSHSLAERVRREKINERMKLLQDLVPGCSKVTGKAVMLDEIINYVQSLQQQVEFLSMKLAAINPRLDIDIEAVLSKYLLRSCNGPSAAIAFSSDIVHPQLHLSQQGFVQAGSSGMVNPPDLLRRSINTQMTAVHGYKEPKMQVPNAWDEELHNVMQMTYSNNVNLNTHRDRE